MSDLDELEAAIRQQAEQKIAAGRALAGSRDQLKAATEDYRKNFAAALKHFGEEELKALGLLVDGIKPAAQSARRRVASGKAAKADASAKKEGAAPAAPAVAEEAVAGESPAAQQSAMA
ncbi:hypothetical protein [Nocardia sp. NPDC004860]|uniref:hypothetical protein n=1 Tax=Nocardia sp. NPDC004860 TaxID=3154557 RepID=UPI0033A0F787